MHRPRGVDRPDPFQRRPIGRALGQVLREARKAAGHKQETLGRLVGIDIKYVSLLERGGRAPSIAVVFAFAKVLGMEPEELVKRVRLTLAKNQRLESRAWRQRSPILKRWKPPER